MSKGIQELLEAGVHFGHQTRRWNPKMKPYIFRAHNGVHIIDLTQTVDQLQAACNFLGNTIRGGGKILFVGTKKQAQPIIRELADTHKQHFVTDRWLGGMLTNLKTVKLASCRYLDDLPTRGNAHGHAVRDRALEETALRITQELGIGAQFGGKYFCHDVRVIRLPRHGASCPVGIGVSCSADRQIKAKITSEGVFLEQLERDPARFMPAAESLGQLSHEVVKIDLNRSMDEIRAELSKYPVKTRVSLSGPMIVARDIAHAKLKELLDSGQGLPDYIKDNPVYYAGPAKRPDGMPSGSFGPTTAGRMDPYVAPFQAAGGSLVMIAKGNRSKQVTDACAAHGGFYLGSIGGQAAVLAHDNIKKVEVLAYPELGMEAVWRIEVEDFPAFIVVDDKGNDFFKQL